ncbi:unnamed protein product [Cylicocyclus nassatus]|uniref:Transthyretin-like family protein n=1 Tax=Cylicocyclus nassatus TaxID=53992 RepID=A0AA36DNY5_CYLNA|nr:unnamed protein product [Cylicocyclus nassatus]
MEPQLLLVLILISCCYSMRQQSVAVSGRLMCGNRPAAGVKVKLWDEDDGPDPDDVLDEQFTDESGAFLVKIYHDCDDGILPGQRKLKFYIPDSYISAGGIARRVFNLGYLNLETIFPGEERDLF